MIIKNLINFVKGKGIKDIIFHKKMMKNCNQIYLLLNNIKILSFSILDTSVNAILVIDTASLKQRRS